MFDSLLAILEAITLIIDFVIGIFTGLMYVVTELIGLVNAIITLGYNITSQLFSLYSILLIDTWTSVIMLGLSISISLRVWYFVKGISIFGFKVG